MTSPRHRVGHYVRMSAWLVAYAAVAPLAWLTRTRNRARLGMVVLASVGVLAFAAGRSCTRPSLRLATFNIENYGGPGKRTDERRLGELLVHLDADVIAVQEIQDPARFARFVGGLQAAGRRFEFVGSSCGGKGLRHVGFVVDVAHVRMVGLEEYPELAPGRDDGCAIDDRPGLLGQFAVEGQRFDVLVVHLSAGKFQAGKRRDQWDRAIRITDQRRAAGGAPIAIVGDVNSTGFLDDDQGERTFIRDRLEAAGLRLLTNDLRCSEYYRPENARHLEPSALDHIAATTDFPSEGAARVTGYCAKLRCSRIDSEPPLDFSTVSDHCPVVVAPARGIDAVGLLPGT